MTRYLPDRKRIKGVCTYCEGPVKPPKRYWCSDACVHEWKIRRDGAYMREHVEKRDKGVCSKCSLDTMKPYLELVRLRKAILKLHFGRQAAEAAKLAVVFWTIALKHGHPLPEGKDPVTYLVRNRVRSLWEANHIQAVWEGGGACGLDNIETVCIPCHKEITRDQAAARAAAKRANARPAKPKKKTRKKKAPR